uniref:Uncharacterized protein n=1 Tax=Solanum tuberosum TaxID=4113 RepID=M1DG98_SOLTU
MLICINEDKKARQAHYRAKRSEKAEFASYEGKEQDKDIIELKRGEKLKIRKVDDSQDHSVTRRVVLQLA